MEDFGTPFGRVSNRFALSLKMEYTPMARTRKNTVAPASIQLDWSAIEADLNAGRKVSLSVLAKAFNVFPIDLRKIFQNRFGDRIVFKRGRTGGIYWKTSAGAAVKQPTVRVTQMTPTPAPVVAAPVVAGA
jgi:hypothetical protein